MEDYRSHYSLFIKANAGLQHYAAHSHHYWPDVTRQAMLDYWDDSSRWTDTKWSKLFELKLPEAQRLIANHLGLRSPECITFAQSTHELVYRLISCLPRTRPARVLTTDSEFLSFSRQLSRLIESGAVQAVHIPVEPFETFQERWTQAARQEVWDMGFLSQVFFNSGLCIQNIQALTADAFTDPKTLIVLDGYHGFMAVPTDLGPIADRVFYLAGSYKYAQGGEGCCFMVSPPNTLRPEYTGWFAEAAHLENAPREVQYPDSAFRFAGGTMDFSPLYRLIASLSLFERIGLTVPKIHAHVQELQARFLATLARYSHPILNRERLIASDLSHHGHFLTFRCPSAEQARALAAFLRTHQILVDVRGDRLRFGFGLYQSPDIDLSCLSAS